MADVNANINIGINTTAAIGSLRALQSQISQFNQSVVSSNAAAAAAQRNLTSNLVAQIGATKAFTTSFQNIETGASRLQTAIDKNRLSLGQYFKYGVASTRAFGTVFREEHNQIMDLAADRVKRLQTQYMALEGAQAGVTRTLAVRPMQLFNADAQVGIQRQQLFNKLLRDGSTSLVNWGKNTQWAGRQLMVGFTVPLTIFGGYAASVFMDLDKQITQFQRVYGDAMTPAGEADAMAAQLVDLAREYTKYGIAASDALGLAADAAATGLQQEELLAATEQALRLATLGQIDYQQALDATISLQSAFDISSQDLASTIDFLNATENETIVALDDITQAIPRVAPVIKGLGGDVRDLAIFLAAMREGGVNAAEGANALKSGLASLINPTTAANEMLKEFGIDLPDIIGKNMGNLRGTVIDFAKELDKLSQFERQQILAKMFGKYQFARLGALFKNIIRDGSQASRVMDLAGLSIKELADISEKDLGRLEESISTRFLGAVERLKLAIAPIGEEFLRVVTPILEWVTGIIEKFQELSPETKKWGLILVGALGVALPTIVMAAGLFGNFIGSLIKGFSVIKNLFDRLRGAGAGANYYEGEMLDAMAASSSLEGQTNNLTRSLNVQREAVDALARAYQNYLRGAQGLATNLPQAMAPVPSARTTPVTVTPTTTQTTRAEKRYSYRGSKSMTQQLTEAGLNPEEYARAEKAGAAARTAVSRYYLKGMEEGAELTPQQQKQVDNFAQVSRAHLVEVMDKSVKEAWDPRLWVSQTQVENQLSQTLASSDPTRELYEKHLRNIYGDTQEVNVLMGKVNAGLALTEQELQMQAKVLRSMIADAENTAKIASKQFIPTAIGVEAAARSRAAQKTAPYMRSDADVIAAQEQLEAAIRKRVAGETSAAQAAQEVSAASDQLEAAMRKAAAEHAESAAVASQSARAAAAAQFAAGKGLPMATPQIQQGIAGQAGTTPGRATSDIYDLTGKKIASAGDQIDEAGNAVKSSGIKGAAKKFGTSLIRGSAKLQTSLFALDGLAFGLSMMDNQIGEFASQMMPLVFGIQGITMMLPMFANPWGAALGAIGAIGAAAVGFNMAMDNARAEMQQMAQSMIATRETIDAVGEFYGRESLAASRRSEGIAERADVAPPQIEKAREFLASGVGQELFNGLNDAIQKFGQANAVKQFAANLSSMVLQGVMTAREARAVAGVIGEQLGNETFGIMLQGQLKSIIGPNGQLIDKDPLRIALTIDRQNQATVDLMTAQVEGLGQKYQEYFQWTPGDLGAFVAMTPIGGMINAFNKFTLSWDNWLGDAARWARGTLNLDDFETVNAQLETMGMFVGNQLAQGYENLAAAQERILGLEERAREAEKRSRRAEKAREKDPSADTRREARRAREEQYDAEAAVRRANQQERRLQNSLQSQKDQLVSMYTSATADVQAALDRGIASSFAEMYKDQPMMQAFYDMIDWTQVPTDKKIRLQLELASGVLDPMTFNALIGMSGSTTAASNIFLNISARLGGDSAEATKALQSVLSAGLGQPVEQKIIWNMEAKGGAAIKETTNALNLIAEVSDDDLRKQLSLETTGMTLKQLKQYQGVLDAFNNLPPNLQKKAQVAYEEYGVKGLEEATEALEWFAKIPEGQLEKKATVEVLTDKFDLTQEQVDEWNATPDSKKIDLVLEWSTEGLDPDAPPEIPEPEPVTTEVNPPSAANLASVDDNITAYNWTPIDLSTSSNVDFTAADTSISTHVPPRIRVPVTYVATNTPETAETNDFTGGLIAKAMGGIIKRFARGGKNEQNGFVPGDGSRDSVLALLTPGEFIMRKATVDKYGEGFFRALNMSAYAKGGIAKYHRGGGVDHVHRSDQKEDIKWHRENDPTYGKKQSTSSATSSDSDTSNAAEDAKQKAEDIKNALKDFKQSIEDMVKTYVDINAGIKSFVNGSASIVKAVLKNNGLSQMLRSAGLNDNIVQEVLGMGVDAAKKWYQQYTTASGKLTKEGLAQVAAMTAAFVTQQMDEYKSRTITAQTQLRAFNFAGRRGGPNEDVQREIAEDPESAQAYAALIQERANAQKELNKAEKSGDKKAIKQARKDLEGANKAILSYERGVRKSQKAEQDLAKALDPVAFAIEKIDEARQDTLNRFSLLEAKFQKAFGEIERAAAPAIKASEGKVNALEDEITLYEDQIYELEKVNAADQRRIDSLDREKEMISRNIENLERLNELDQRGIERLQREDELRNRVADALSKELEQMSIQEEKIRTAYQNRISALDKVSEINQHIIDQQKNQISLSQALSQGDIFAAAQAAQERRQQQAQYAAQQTREALEQGAENAVAGLRTEGGLSREQAEQKIAQIREQSYQTSLLIRDIEDRIFARNQQMVPLKDQIREKDLQIRDISDQIYARNLQIQEIEVNKLEPKQRQLELEQRHLTQLQEDVENKKASLQIDGMTYEQLQNQISAESEAYDLAVAQVKANENNVKAIGQIVRQWNKVAQAIANANRTARQMREQAEAIAANELQNVSDSLGKKGISASQAAAQAQAVRNNLANQLAAIENQRIAAIEAARKEGMNAITGMNQYYTGGMIKGYAAGSLIGGTGSRDSVVARLTPGEFVMRKAAVDKYGAAMMQKINSGAFKLPSYSMPSSSTGTRVNRTNVESTFAPVYNSYGINVNVSGTNASADEIANKAVMKIREMNSMQIRSSRVK